MSRLEFDYTPTPKTAALFENIKNQMGSVINIFKLMGHSPIALEGFLGFSGTLSQGRLTPQEREYIALVVATFDRCEYCASAHTLLAQKAGISQEEAAHTLNGKSAVPRIQALIQFCQAILKQRGNVTDAEFELIREAGFDKEQIIEIIANIALNVFTNYFNNLAQTPIDFPKVSLPLEMEG